MRALICCVAAIALAPAIAVARPDSPNSPDLFKYAQGDKVESFPSGGGNFRVHFTRAGASAVPLDDANKNNVPDHVEAVAQLYEDVLAFYLKLGFRRPLDDGKVPGNNGGDARFDVYLLDFAGKADGHFEREQCAGSTCEGFMIQENDFAGYPYPSVEVGNRILGSHEFFHAVQAAYNVDQSSIISEGTAVWATEKFDDTLDDFEGFAGGYLDHPDRSLDKPLPGPVDVFSYGSALFFEFLDEHVGGDVIRELWEDCVEGARGVANPDWFTVLPALLVRHKTTFADELLTFAVWNLFTGKRADPTQSYARGAGYPAVKMTGVQAFYRDDTLRLFTASTQYLRMAPGNRTKMTAVVNSMQDIGPLRLSISTRVGTKVGKPVPIDSLAAGPLATVDTGNIDEVTVILVNTAQSGDSIRGTVCVGSPEEVEACRPVAPDMAMAPDLGMGMMSMGGGCAVGGGRGERGMGIGVVLGLGWMLARRRRRNQFDR